MDLTQEQLDRLEEAMRGLEELDPAEVPRPAADLAAVLASILEESESS
jgi:hypothetical protein